MTRELRPIGAEVTYLIKSKQRSTGSHISIDDFWTAQNRKHTSIIHYPHANKLQILESHLTLQTSTHTVTMHPYRASQNAPARAPLPTTEDARHMPMP